MPLILLCGQPCSGKSTIAAALKMALEENNWPVVVVDEPSLHLDRNSSYKDSAAEKTTRGLLRSAVDKSVTKSCVVILDSLNNIKGYRYELWCVARAAGTRYCVVHCTVPPDTCRQWNQQRPATEQYQDVIFDDLAGRFETPDQRNRWDCPLFEVNLAQEAPEQVVCDVVLSLTDNAAAPTQRQAKELTPSCATTNPALTETNLLFQLDKAAQDVIRVITSTQASSTGIGGGCTVEFGGGLPLMQLQRYIPLAELRNHKRNFLKIATQVVAGKITEAAIARKIFIEYLKDNLGS